MQLDEKVVLLHHLLLTMDNLAVAFSGGVDSTFLLKTAHDLLGDRAIAITVDSPTFPRRDFQSTVKFTEENHIRHIIMQENELDIPGFAANPRNRCYLCKRSLYLNVWEIARQNNINNIADGSNLDDLGDFRPGRAALTELGVASPLLAAHLGKQEIRKLSHKIGLPTWARPASACLASRFVYGEVITAEKLGMVEKAEECLKKMGLEQVRVRIHKDVARIEVGRQERCWFFDETRLDKVSKELRQIGFKYVALDLEGYRTGSMNESLT